MNNEKIAEQIISSMGSQLDLIFALSVAICGGIIALTIQMLIKDRSFKVLRLDSVSRRSILILMPLVFVTEGASILFGYMSRGSITSNIPIIFKQDFTKVDHWENADFVGCSVMAWLFEFQFFTFFLGILLLSILLITLLVRNRHYL